MSLRTDLPLDSPGHKGPPVHSDVMISVPTVGSTSHGSRGAVLGPRLQQSNRSGRPLWDILSSCAHADLRPTRCSMIMPRRSFVCLLVCPCPDAVLAREPELTIGELGAVRLPLVTGSPHPTERCGPTLRSRCSPRRPIHQRRAPVDVVQIPGHAHALERALPSLLFVLAVALCAAMAGGPHGLVPSWTAQSAHVRSLPHSAHGHDHHHVREVVLERRASQRRLRRSRDRQRQQWEAGPGCHPRWPRWRLRAPPVQWPQVGPPPTVSIRLRICLLRV